MNIEDIIRDDTIAKEKCTPIEKSEMLDRVSTQRTSSAVMSSSMNCSSALASVLTVQQTSVITPLPKRTPGRGTRQKYMQRQKGIDVETLDTEVYSYTNAIPDAMISTSTTSALIHSDRNNNDEKLQRNEYSVSNFINETTSSTKPKNIPNKANNQQHQQADIAAYDQRLYKHLANGYFNKKGKSKSLDLVEADDEHLPKQHSYPVRYPPYPSYEDEQTARYIKDLHISSPGTTLFGQSSFPNSPSGSPIDSSLRQSPVPSMISHSSPLRRAQPEGNSRYPMNDGSSITSKPSFAVNRSPDSHTSNQLAKSRSHEQRLYKFQKLKSYSLNTAPYDLTEKNLRRIFSEENVPENVLISKAMNKQYPHLRRAASYETFSRFNPHTNNQARTSPHRAGSSDAYSRPQQQQPVKATKIMFPEHDNVKDCNSIFTQPIEDEQTHTMRINSIMDKSFSRSMELLNSYTPPHSSLSLDEGERINGNKKKAENALSKSKSLQSQSSIDKNYTIGPYQYDPQVDNELAVSVSGLLTLPGSNEKKYPITVGELRRRIAPPEFLNKVDMISYVRLAKSSARELLEKHAIRPKHHSRKSKHSVISKMCEAECTELSNGVKALSDAYFPKEWLANQMFTSLHSDDEMVKRQKLTEMQRKIEITRGVLKDFSGLLEQFKSHDEMQNYNLATHSFGMSNLNNNIDMISSFLQTQTDVIVQRISSSDILSSESMETESGFGSKNSSIDDQHY